MNVKFCKMHGLGNDFVVINNVDQKTTLTPEQVKQLAHRHFGIGFDQLLMIEPAQNDQEDFHYTIYNADGSLAEQCGNGVRCIARYIKSKGLSSKNELRLGTGSGCFEVHCESGDLYTVNMGPPIFEPNQIPFKSDQYRLDYQLELDGEPVHFSAVSMGNPHAVLKVEHIDHAPVHTLGRKLSIHSAFPQGVNVEFMQVNQPSDIHLRVYERGTGETLACGSGACAAVVVGQQQGWLSDKVSVKLLGGELRIQWQGQQAPVFMTGSASYVYEGELDLC